MTTEPKHAAGGYKLAEWVIRTLNEAANKLK